MMKPETDAERAVYTAMIGTSVVKRSGKPFKSGKKIGTVKGTTMHPMTHRTSFTFLEDESYVECIMCERWTPKELR